MNKIPRVKILVILAHPDKSSFNHAIAGTVVRALEENRHEVIYHDLYTERFSSTLTTAEIFKNFAVPRPIGKYCAELAAAEGIIIVHPNWWGQPPAILKGYIDRVFRPGVAYEFAEGDDGEGIPIGLLKARAALVFNTSNTGLEREEEVFGDPLQSIWKRSVFDLCGVKTFYRRTFGVIVTSTLEDRRSWLDEVDAVVSSYFPAVISRVRGA